MATRPFPLFPLLFLAAIFYVHFVARVLLAPLLPVVEVELGLGHGAAGSLFLFQSLGQAAGVLLSGLVSWRLNHRSTVLISTASLGLALLALSAAASLGTMRLVMVGVGVAAGLYLPAAIAILTHQTDETQWGQATAIHELAPGLGFISAPLLAEALLRRIPWHAILASAGALLLVAALLYARWGTGGRHRGEPPRLRTMIALLADGGLARIAVMFTLAVGAGYGVYMMLPLVLVAERGLDRGAANSLVALSRVLTLPMIFWAGWIADRLGHLRALVAFQVATGLLTVAVALTAAPTSTGVTTVLHAAASVCFFPACYPLIAVIVRPARRNLAVSMVSLSGTLLGAGLIPALIGYVADAASFALALAALGLLTAVSPALLRVRTRTD